MELCLELEKRSDDVVGRRVVQQNRCSRRDVRGMKPAMICFATTNELQIVSLSLSLSLSLSRKGRLSLLMSTEECVVAICLGGAMTRVCG